MKIKKIYKKALAMATAFSLLFLIACSDARLEIRHSTNDYLIQSRIPDNDFNAIQPEAGVGIWKNLSASDFYWDWEERGDWNQTIVLNEDDGLLEFRLANISDTKRYFLIKPLLDFESIPFKVLGENQYVEEFIVSVQGGYEIVIPFKLGRDLSDEQKHSFMVLVFLDPHENAVDSYDTDWGVFGLSINFSGSSLRVNLARNETSRAKKSMPNYTPIARRNGEWFPEIQINQMFDLNQFHTKHSPTPIENYVKAQAGEGLELSYFVRLIPEFYELDQYLITAFLDWKQVSINGKPYLLIDVEDYDYDVLVEHGRFMLDIPEEPGKYELIVMRVSNPFTSVFPMYESSDFTHRITVIVE